MKSSDFIPLDLDFSSYYPIKYLEPYEQNLLEIA